MRGRVDEFRLDNLLLHPTILNVPPILSQRDRVIVPKLGAVDVGDDVVSPKKILSRLLGSGGCQGRHLGHDDPAGPTEPEKTAQRLVLQLRPAEGHLLDAAIDVTPIDRGRDRAEEIFRNVRGDDVAHVLGLSAEALEGHAHDLALVVEARPPRVPRVNGGVDLDDQEPTRGCAGRLESVVPAGRIKVGMIACGVGAAT